MRAPAPVGAATESTTAAAGTTIASVEATRLLRTIAPSNDTVSDTSGWCGLKGVQALKCCALEGSMQGEARAAVFESLPRSPSIR